MSSFKNVPAVFQREKQITSYKPARYSVQRIESAKQKALTGQSFAVVKSNKKNVDWIGDDEAELLELIQRWNPATGHQGLNELIDNHQFSHGTQHENTGVDQLTIDDTTYKHLGAGTIRYIDRREPPANRGNT